MLQFEARVNGTLVGVMEVVNTSSNEELLDARIRKARGEFNTGIRRYKVTSFDCHSNEVKVVHDVMVDKEDTNGNMRPVFGFLSILIAALGDEI